MKTAALLLHVKNLLISQGRTNSVANGCVAAHLVITGVCASRDEAHRYIRALYP